MLRRVGNTPAPDPRAALSPYRPVLASVERGNSGVNGVLACESD